MGKLGAKRCLTVILAGVIVSVGGVLSLLTSPARALDDIKCKAWAQEIKGRTEDLAQDPDIGQGSVKANTCPNLCLVDDANTEVDERLTDLKVTPFLRQAGQGPSILAATITEFLDAPLGAGGQPTGDKAFVTGSFGPGAFFCADVNNTGNITSAVVAIAHPAPTTCGTGYTEICSATLP
ncbi:MAG: hypothetical protein ACE5JU_25515 [Candidatus Binatia bacterium]